MIIEQQHIINKVFLEVDTNSATVAHNLKDRLDLFLKEDILPYLDTYFKSIEQTLPAEIVQIPQLTLDIKTTNHNDFKTLKTATKEKLVQKIETLLKTPSQTTEEVILINSQEHQTRSLLFFIENGYTPWWKTTRDSIPFTPDEIAKTISNKTFSNKYVQLLQKPVCKKRSIQQFTDQQLQQILKTSFKNTQQVSFLEDSIIKTFTPLSTVSRDFIWNELITYIQSKQLSVLIENLSFVIIKNTAVLNQEVYAFAKAILAIIQQAIKISTSDVAIILQKELKNTLQNKMSLASQLMTIYDTINLSKEATVILNPWLENINHHTKKTKEIANQEKKNTDTNQTEANNASFNKKEATNKQVSNTEAKQTKTLYDEKITSQEEIIETQHKKEHTTIDAYIKKVTSQQNEGVFINTGTYYIPNAGLMILHPYIYPFLKNCGIIDDNNTITDVDLAIHILHYLATKKEQQLESQMLFEKFLCGVPLKNPIQRHVQLSDTIKQHAEELLESVIENWGALNNASTDLLRHEFLQREGKLSFTEDNPKIVIERKTQDILVDKIPWGIGICRLPWLDHMIFTNW